MVVGNISRRLAVLVHADVAGSTTLVQRDEALAHARIGEAFERLASTVRLYGGSVHEIRGDALVAEFSRASDAVCATLKFQEANTSANRGVIDGVAAEVRIGISLGEVVSSDNKVTGAGVVLAQRIEQLAKPGGLCISGAVHEAIPRSLPLVRRDLGERRLKGFDDPVKVYELTLRPGEEPPGPEAPCRGRPSSRRARLMLVGIVSGGLIFSLGAFWSYFGGMQVWKPSRKEVTLDVSRPSLAVLPFENFSDEASQEYFSDGITEDLITELSKIHGLFVISRNSTFLYKGQTVDVKDVALALGVRYVLEGSVRREGSRVRVNAQLIDGLTGGHIWAERYDGALGDVFSLQDTITDRIVSELAVKLSPPESANIAAPDTSDIVAYDAFLRGRALQRLNTPAGGAAALAQFRDALKRDPGYSKAYAAMAQIFWDYSLDAEFNRLIGQPPDHTLIDTHATEAWKLLQNVRTEPISQAHALRARMQLRMRQYDEAKRSSEKAVNISPNDASAYDALIETLMFAGEPLRGLDLIDASLALDPKNPGEKLFLRASCLYLLDRLDESLMAVKRARTHNPEQKRYLVLEAVVRWDLGQNAKAIAVFEEYRSRVNAFTTTNWFAFTWPFAHRAPASRFRTSLTGLGAQPSATPIQAALQDRMSGPALVELLSDKAMVGRDVSPRGQEAGFEIIRDKDLQILRQGYLTYFRTGTGTSRVENGLLCDPWYQFGDYCIAVYRNSAVVKTGSADYVFFTLSGPFVFEVLKAEMAERLIDDYGQ